MALGVGESRLIASEAGWPIVIDPRSVAMAFGFAPGIGIFLGFYPARKTSRLGPIAAPRHE